VTQPSGGVEEVDEFTEELDDDEEADLPGDDGLEVGGEQDPVQMKHQVTYCGRIETHETFG